MPDNTQSGLPAKRTSTPVPTADLIAKTTNEVTSLVGLLAAFNNSIDALPKKEKLFEMEQNAKNQLVVGKMVIPAIIESIRSISDSLDTSELDKFKDQLGVDTSESDNKRRQAQEKLNLEISELTRQLNELDVNADAQKRYDLEMRLMSKNHELQDLANQDTNSIVGARFLISEKINTSMDAINQMVAAVNRFSSIKVPTTSSKNISKIENSIKGSYDAMVGLVADLSSYMSSDEINKAMGWKDSGVSEYLTGIDKETGQTIYLEKDVLNKATGEIESERIQNPNYYKPHFAAEDGIFKIGDFITKMVAPIQKVSSIDLGKISGPGRLKRNMQRLAASMTAMVESTIKEFSKIDTEGSKETIELLIGSEGTEITVDKINQYSTGEGADAATEFNQSTERVLSGKRASVIDVVTSVLDSATKITSFEFKEFFKKSIKFRALTPLVSAQIKGIVTSVSNMFPSDVDYAEMEGRSKDLNKFIEYFNENGISKVAGLKVNDKKLRETRRKVRHAKRCVHGIISDITGIVDDMRNSMYENSESKTEEAVSGEPSVPQLQEGGAGGGSKPPTGKKVDYENILADFNDLSSKVIDSVSDIANLKLSAKEALSSLVALKIYQMVFSAIMSIANKLTKNYDGEVSAQQQIAMTEASNLIKAIGPGFEAFSEMSAAAAKVKLKGIIKLSILLGVYINTLENLSNSNIDLDKIIDITGKLDELSKSASNIDLDDLIYSKIVLLTYVGSLVEFASMINSAGSEFSDGIKSAREMGLDEFSDQVVEIMKGAAKIQFISMLLGSDTEWIETIFGSEDSESGEGVQGVLTTYILGILNLANKIAKNADGVENIETAKDAMSQIAEMSGDLVAVVMDAGIVSILVRLFKPSKDDVSKTEHLIGIMMVPIEKLGDKKTAEKISNAWENTKTLAKMILLLTATSLVIGVVVYMFAKEIIVGMGVLALMCVGSILILRILANSKGNIVDGSQALKYIAISFLMFSFSILLLGLAAEPSGTALAMFGGLVIAALLILLAVQWITNRGIDKGTGLPNACKPLLAIAGSFIMFSLSILLLSLVNDMTWQAMVSFAVIVGIAVGVLFLLSLLKKEVTKGALAMLIMGAAFIVFSGVVAILAAISNDMDFLNMLGLVGVIGALIGVGCLAGLAIIPLALGSLGIILLSVGLIAMSVAMLMMIGVAALVKDPKDTISPIINTIKVIVESMSGIPVKDVFLAMANAAMMSVLMLTLVAVCGLVKVLEKIAPDQEGVERITEAMLGVTGSIAVICKHLSLISFKDIGKALAISGMALAMLVPLSLVMLILLGLSRLRIATEFDDKNKPVAWESVNGSSFDRVGEAMNGMVSALKTVTEGISSISMKDMTRALIISAEALAMVASVSGVMALLIKLGGKRIPVAFNNKNEPTAWETVNESHIEQAGEIAGLLVDSIHDMAVIIGGYDTKMIKTAAKNAKKMRQITKSISSMLDIVTRLTEGPIKYGDVDENGNPKGEYGVIQGNLGDYLKSHKTQVTDNINTLIEIFDSIAKKIAGKDGIGNINTSTINRAKRNMKQIGKITKALDPAINLIMSLTSGEYNIGTEAAPNMVNLGKFITEKRGDVEENLTALFGFISFIGERAEDMNKMSSKTLRKADKKMTRVGQIIEALNPAIDLIMRLTDGEYELEENGTVTKVNLGQFLNKKSGEVRKNVKAVIDLVGNIATDVTKALMTEESPTKKDLRVANRKIGKVGKIIDSLNPAMDLIMRLSEGKFQIELEDKTIKEVNLGEYLATQAPVILTNVESLIAFVKQIAEKTAIFGAEDKSNKKDLKKGAKKAGLVNGVLETISVTLDLIQSMASGNFEVGKNEDGTPITENLSKFLSENSEGIRGNLELLINFIVGENGIQSYIDKLTGEKDKSTEKKQNSISLINDMTDVIGKILDMTVKLGEQVNNDKTKDLFGTDTNTNLQGRLGRLLEGYSVPLADSAIFAKQSEFKVRFKNLSDYNDLMKKIMEVENVADYETSVKATGDMVNSINSINDTKIDKLNTLMRNMIKFGETMDEALKDVFDQIVELAEELHYIIEANDRKQNPQNYTGKNNRLETPWDKKQNQQNAQQPQQQQQIQVQRSETDLSGVESKMTQIIEKLEQIRKG